MMAALGESNVDHVGDLLPVLAALSNVHDLPNFHVRKKFDSETRFNSRLLVGCIQRCR